MLNVVLMLIAIIEGALQRDKKMKIKKKDCIENNDQTLSLDVVGKFMNNIKSSSL